MLLIDLVSELSEIKIPRWVYSSQTSTCDILILGDTSEIAYSATAYLRVKEESCVNVNLLMSKTKLAPLKQVSIPRLELCSALLDSCLTEIIFNFCMHLPCRPSIHLFTDSTVVLGTLNTPPYRLKTFVANRVTRILELKSLNQWSHSVQRAILVIWALED